MADPAPRRPWGWRIHAALGAMACTLLAVVCLTGTVATVSHELEWLAAERKRAGPLPHATSLGERWDAARAALPGFTPTSISRTGTASDREWYLATLVQGGAADGGQATVYVDPATARVQGVVHGVTFPSFLRGLHYYLFDVSPWTIGFYVLAALGPVMLVMTVTGLRLHRRWWSGLRAWPRRDLPARGWWGAVHRLAALWSVPFILVIGLTVVWYLVEWDGWVDWNQWGPQIADARPLPLDRTVTGADIDRWVTIAVERQPGLVVSGVALPWEPGGAVAVTGQRSALVVRERANAVHIDPVTDEVRAEQVAHAMPVRERWTHTADPLHFGDFAGLPSKLLWVACGSLLVLVSVSGAVVCLRRAARRSPGP